MDAPARRIPPDTAPLDHAAVLRIIFGIMLAMFLGALDQTIVATALPTIGRELGDAADLSWIITAYLLSSTAVTPLYGKLSDVYGRRVMLLLAICVFVVGSVACALSPDMLTLILMRGVQGLGGGGLISLAQTILADIISPRERARYQTYIASMFVMASVGGPVLGGLMAQHMHWSLIFWVNLPLGIAAYVMTDRSLRQLPRHDRRHRIDVLGAFLMMAAASTLLLAITWGGVAYPWGSGRILGLIAASVVLWGCFALRIATAAEPFLPLSILFNAVVRNAIMAAFFGMGTLIGLCMVIPIYLETLRGHDASTSGLMLIALMGGTPFGAMMAGRAMARWSRYKVPALIGLTLSSLLIFLLGLFPLALPGGVLLGFMVLIGAGIGCVLPLSTVSLQNAVPIAQMGIATGAMNFFRALGSALIVAVLSAVFFMKLGGTGDGSLEQMAARAIARGDDLAGAFAPVFYVAAGLLALSLAAIAAMRTVPLRTTVTPEMTE
ncbi:MAG: MDR family MFS transporter [Zavarzinia sp.]|nr:MDR family MFS transporter [Zavarzinia sp.]